jgi:hypothetical protein
MVLFGIIVLAIIFFIVSTVTSYVLYLFMIFIIPIIVFILSFFFGFIPFKLFDKFYNNGGPEKPDNDEAFKNIIYSFRYGLFMSVLFFNSIYKWTMGKIDPLPNIVKYIIASACIFVTFMIIIFIVAISVKKT